MKAITQFKIQAVDYLRLNKKQKMLAIANLKAINKKDQEQQLLFIRKHEAVLWSIYRR